MKNEPIIHEEEFENAAREHRPVMLSQAFRYDHVQHNIPIGSIVEVDVRKSFQTQGEIQELKGVVKLIVVKHTRDCDGTPLYALSAIPVIPPEQVEFQKYLLYCHFADIYEHNYDEESLKPTGTAVPKMFNTLQEWMNL